MLTLRSDRPPVINTDRRTINIWDEETLRYETHSFEFIEYLAELIKNAQIEALAK